MFRAVYALGLTVFCIGTTENMISGLLPVLAGDLSVSVPAVGWLISGYALGVVVGGPALTAGLLRVERRAALLGLLGLFVLGQTLAALAPGYPVLMVGRVISAVAQGAFFGIGTVVASDLVGPERRGRAMAVMFAGLTVANVLGVPAATVLGEHGGWRAAFWVVDALALVALGAVAVLVPRRPAPPHAGVAGELGAFRSRRVWIALATSMLTQAAVFACFSYLSPLLTEVSGFPADAVAGLLLLFGLGCLAGSALGGWLTDRRPQATLLVGVLAMGIVLALLAGAAGSRPATIVLLIGFGVAAFAINPALQAQVVREAESAPTLAATTNTSAFNVGNTLGPAIGGAVIGQGLGFTAPVWSAALLSAAGLAVAGLAARRAPSGSTPDSPDPSVPTSVER